MNIQSFQATEIPGYDARQIRAQGRASERSSDQFRLTQPIKNSVGSWLTRLVFFFFPDKAEKQARAICDAAKKIIDQLDSAPTMSTPMYVENLKQKIQHITEDVYTGKILFDQEREKICSTFSDFLQNASTQHTMNRPRQLPTAEIP